MIRHLISMAQNKKIKTNKFKNNQYYELKNDDSLEDKEDLEDQNDDILI